MTPSITPARLREILEALEAAKALAVCCMATDCYSRKEIEQMGRAQYGTFRAALGEKEKG